MPREFYTEKDIEDLFKGGVMSLPVHDHVVLTELAYEKARALGVKLVRNSPDQPPSAPVRPYISQTQGQLSSPAVAAPIIQPLPLHKNIGAEKGAPVAIDLPRRIREAVAARIGAQVDANLLDVIIKRVLASTGVK
jgi:hypothetical protein